MKTFIKVTEIWVPDESRTQLKLANGIYGPLNEFKAVSEQTRFEFGQGLPGTVWQEARPVAITDLTHSCFQRTEAALQNGLTCAIALPVFAGEFLLAVMVFLCGDDEEHAGAIEVWANDSERTNELGVIEGYYGTLEYFEFISRKTKIMKSFGLPGQLWEKGLPILMSNLDDTAAFIRGREAKNAGITTALGIPFFDKGIQVYLMTFLSAKQTPIARQIEIWLPNSETKQLEFDNGFSETGANLSETYQSKTYAKGEGMLGRVWLTGIPAIAEDYGVENSIETLFMPVISLGTLTAVVVFCL